VRSCFIQHPDESDAGFAQRLLRASGIAWFWRPCAADLAGTYPRNLPRQELVLFDDAQHLPQAAAGALRLHRRDATGSADTIDLLAPRWRLSPAGVTLRSWDHEAARVDAAQAGNPASRDGFPHSLA
jgi:type VI secretion system secreted protein VgrG